MHILILIISFQEKVKNYFLFSVIFFYKFSRFTPKNPKRPNGQSANMAHFVAFFISFQKIIPSKIPPGRGTGVIGGSRTKRCYNRESKTFLCTSDKAGFFSNKKYDSYKCWTCTEFSEAFTFLMENIYLQFDGTGNQQVVGILMGTYCATKRNFMSNLQKS